MGACSAGLYSHYARRLYEREPLLSIPFTLLAARLFGRAPFATGRLVAIPGQGEK
jgi:hypothetical protein